MTQQFIGTALDDMGVTADLDDDEHVIDAVVLLRVGSAEQAGTGETRLVIGASASCDGIVQSGLVNQARSVVDALEPDGG